MDYLYLFKKFNSAFSFKSSQTQQKDDNTKVLRKSSDFVICPPYYCPNRK